ncbi:transposase [Patescibacteria group bacterium]|nr:transposase [Patescibacteria group bacterium]
MPQKHYVQSGMLHITTNTQNGVPWCTWKGIPEILMNNLGATRNLYNGKIYAFCILPSHMHILLNPGEKGVSAFMQSFKSNSSKDVRSMLPPTQQRRRVAATLNDIHWQKGFYDEIIEDNRQRDNAYDYIVYNPIRHSLVQNINHWPWSSIHFPYMLDTMEI